MYVLYIGVDAPSADGYVINWILSDLAGFLHSSPGRERTGNGGTGRIGSRGRGQAAAVRRRMFETAGGRGGT